MSELTCIEDLLIGSDDFDEDLTIKGYLLMLLEALWEQGEGFSGKRPFGNGGWEYDLYKPLLRHGLVKGELDEDGDINEVDEAAADKLIFEIIRGL